MPLKLIKIKLTEYGIQVKTNIYSGKNKFEIQIQTQDGNIQSQCEKKNNQMKSVLNWKIYFSLLETTWSWLAVHAYMKTVGY